MDNEDKNIINLASATEFGKPHDLFRDVRCILCSEILVNNKSAYVSLITSNIALCQYCYQYMLTRNKKSRILLASADNKQTSISVESKETTASVENKETTASVESKETSTNKTSTNKIDMDKISTNKTSTNKTSTNKIDMDKINKLAQIEYEINNKILDIQCRYRDLDDVFKRKKNADYDKCVPTKFKSRIYYDKKHDVYLCSYHANVLKHRNREHMNDFNKYKNIYQTLFKIGTDVKYCMNYRFIPILDIPLDVHNTKLPSIINNNYLKITNKFAVEWYYLLIFLYSINELSAISRLEQILYFRDSDQQVSQQVNQSGGQQVSKPLNYMLSSESSHSVYKEQNASPKCLRAWFPFDHNKRKNYEIWSLVYCDSSDTLFYGKVATALYVSKYGIGINTTNLCIEDYFKNKYELYDISAQYGLIRPLVDIVEQYSEYMAKYCIRLRKSLNQPFYHLYY